MATQDLNQLYQTAIEAMARTSRFDKGMSRTAPFGYGDVSTATPEQMSSFSTAPYGYGNINEYWNKPEYVINQAERLGLMPSGITTLPAATNIVPSTDPTQDEFLKQHQDAWRAQNPEPAVMPSFRITGTDLPASEAAGYDVPLWEETYNKGLIDPDAAPRHSVIPEQYGDFFNSQFYDPGAAGLGVMTPVTLPTGETITFPDSASANQFQQYLQSLAGGGIVGLDYLTRRL